MDYHESMGIEDERISTRPAHVSDVTDSSKAEQAPDSETMDPRRVGDVASFAIGGYMTPEGWQPGQAIPSEVWDHEELDGNEWTMQGEMDLTRNIGLAAKELGIYE